MKIVMDVKILYSTVERSTLSEKFLTVGNKKKCLFVSAPVNLQYTQQ